MMPKKSRFADEISKLSIVYNDGVVQTVMFA